MSYNQKHNEANKEDTKDGTDENYSWNMGVEGPTDDPEIKEQRERQMRNFLTTLMYCMQSAHDFRRRQGWLEPSEVTTIVIARTTN